MKSKTFTRREVLTTASAGTLGLMATAPLQPFNSFTSGSDKLAILGGAPVRKADWPEWPVWDPSAEPEILEMLRSGKWWLGGGDHVTEFEKAYAELIGSKRCQATASGTTALLVALHVLGVDAGDEVLVSPYTFIATYNSVFISKALPVFVDTDPETFLIDPTKLEERITARTTAVLPVHIYGLPVDMDRVNAVAQKHGLKVVEDACQAWLAEYKGKMAGTLGDLGCFSFQNSKHIPTGEGGAITGDDDALMDHCYSFHNCGRAHGSVQGETPYPTRGSNRRMQQMQAIMLMSQMKRAKKDAETRQANARYLDEKLGEVPGIIPARLVGGDNKAAYHMYPMRYLKEQFDGLPREQFIKALWAEGIPARYGYGPQNRYELIEEALSSRGYKRLYGEARLRRYREENRLPGNDLLCEQAVTFYQNVLLGTRADMDDVVKAFWKVYENRHQIS